MKNDVKQQYIERFLARLEKKSPDAKEILVREIQNAGYDEYHTFIQVTAWHYGFEEIQDMYAAQEEEQGAALNALEQLIGSDVNDLCVYLDVIWPEPFVFDPKLIRWRYTITARPGYFYCAGQSHNIPAGQKAFSIMFPAATVSPVEQFEPPESVPCQQFSIAVHKYSMSWSQESLRLDPDAVRVIADEIKKTVDAWAKSVISSSRNSRK